MYTIAFFAALLLTCSDESTANSKPTLTPHEKRLQQVHMLSILQIADERWCQVYGLIERYNGDPKHSDACLWMGVTCENEIVRRIEWGDNAPMSFRWSDEFLEAPNSFRIEFVPPTVVHLDMNGLYINAEFETRALPRELVDLELIQCGLMGTVNCQTLPLNLRSMMCQTNQLQGTILLSGLPRGLKQLSLAGNPLQKVFVDNSDLPEAFEWGVFSSGDKKVKIASLDGKKVDKRVRVGFDNRGFIE